jgi:hypothetical protein
MTGTMENIIMMWRVGEKFGMVTENTHEMEK